MKVLIHESGRKTIFANDGDGVKIELTENKSGKIDKVVEVHQVESEVSPQEKRAFMEKPQDFNLKKFKTKKVTDEKYRG